MSTVVTAMGECFTDNDEYDEVIDYTLTFNSSRPWEVVIQSGGQSGLIAYEHLVKVKRRNTYNNCQTIDNPVLIVLQYHIVFIDHPNLEHGLMISKDEVSQFMHDCYTAHRQGSEAHEIPDSVPAGWLA
jgi:hypothetical protein